MEITFINEKGFNSPLPITAKENLPEWYQKSVSYIDNKKAKIRINNTYVTTATIKKCMPVYDAITTGYLILSWADIEIFNKDGVIHYKISEPILTDHNIKQAPEHPSLDKKDDLIAKFINTWGIKTPIGYSCLFIPPAHRNNVINIMPAVVDTDTYNLSVHFPFTLKDRTFQGVIPKGTPLVQVIPFQRNTWEMKIEEFSKEAYETIYNKLHETEYNGYKNNFWTSKDYT